MTTTLPRVAVALFLAAGALAGATPAGSQPVVDPLVTDSLAALDELVSGDACAGRDAADNDTGNGVALPYTFCDDGVPPRGGGAAGIPVPVKYAASAAGNDWTGLPPPATVDEVADASAEDLQPEAGNRITLDVDVTLPPARLVVPGGRPVIFFMHGCCGGNRTGWEDVVVDAAREKWHHSNAWYAARGYVVVTYTARGFRDNEDRGSTGSTQLDSRRYEMNDFQYLAGLLADHDAARRAAGEPVVFGINPKKIAAMGGSYGGGFSWLALTDPRWRSPARRLPMRLGAAVPKYGWTDLVEALVPSGHYRDRNVAMTGPAIAPTDPAKAPSRAPIGVLKQSIVAGLYGTGNLVTGGHTTFPMYVHEAVVRLLRGEPYSDDELEPLLDTFLADRSAYYQQGFWTAVSKGLRVPVFAAATWTDPLFPPMESVRFYSKLKATDPRYPITMYLGDVQHFVQNKATEWGDLCGEDHHVCTLADFTHGGRIALAAPPTGLVRTGINTRINRFLDHYLLGRGSRPALNVTATTTVCPANSTDAFPATEPGIEHRAPTWRALAPKVMTFAFEGGGTTSSLGVDAHAVDADPVVRDRQTDKCHTTTQTSAGVGVVTYESAAVAAPFTLMGIPRMDLEYTTTATDYWIAARLYDKAPTGMTMVTRGLCRVDVASAPDVDCSAFDLFGNAWRFEAGHTVVVELSQADTPFLRRDNLPSTITFSGAILRLPVTLPSLVVDARV